MKITSWLHKFIIFTVTVLPAIGALLLLGFYLTSADLFGVLGFFFLFGSIGAGAISGVFIFALFLLRFIKPKTDFVWKIGLTKLSVLLAFSFVFAGVCVSVGENLASNYDVTITNNSPTTLAGITLIDPKNNPHDFGPVSPGQTLKKNFHFKGEGSVLVRIDSIKQEATAFGYITSGMSDDVKITIDRAGKISVEKPQLKNRPSPPQ